MDAAAIAVARAANLAKHGDNNNKEAHGLRLIARAIQEDGRLEFHKSFEKALADCCVYRLGAPALGVQLKTTGVNWVHNKSGYEYFKFSATDGYAGLLIVLVALHVQPPRIWIAEGSMVVSNPVRIPRIFRRGMKSDRVQEVELATVADAIYTKYMEAMSGSSTYVLRSPEDHEKPTERNALAEYNAFKRLQNSLPVSFMDPPAEHMSYDYVVEGKKWQLKLAQYYKTSKADTYRVNCQKNAGTVGGKQTRRQYEVDDFDFLCIQLPENAIDCCYVIPQSVLVKCGIIGDATKSNGVVYVYPHRRLTTTKAVHTAGVHWTETYRIDFAHNPLAKLACITLGQDLPTAWGNKASQL